jgi:single-stranded-DNA-specific exonuclease
VAETLHAYEAEPYSYEEARELSAELGLSDPVAIALVRRGYRTPQEARTFLDADESHEPGEFRSMAGVVEQVLAMIEAGGRITVHGDFDVDGVSATALLVGALRALGAECDWLIPDRMSDGYGLSEPNVRKLAERGTNMIVTVDCGVTAVAEVALAKELGMEVIVTDHHQAGTELPDCPILHPALDGYPFAELCGTGVAWKLACALRGASGAGSPKHSSAAPAARFGEGPRHPRQLGEQLRLRLVELLGRERALFLQLVELVQFVSGGGVSLFADI